MPGLLVIEHGLNGIDKHFTAALPPLEELTELLVQAVDGNLPMVPTRQKSYIDLVVEQLNMYYPWSYLALIPVTIAIASFVVPVPARNTKRSEKIDWWDQRESF